TPMLTIGARDFIDPAATPPDDAVARSLRFDSRSSLDKMPFGAVTTGTEVSFGIEALPGVGAATLVIEKRRLEGPQEILDYSDVAHVALERGAGSDGRERWRGRYRFDAIGVYGYYFVVEIAGRRYVYQNNADP